MSVDLELLTRFIGGYLVIQAIPGPNLLAIGSMATLRGMRGVLPLCLGVALGVGALGATLLVAVTIAPGDGWHRTGRLISAALLGWLAWSVARQHLPEDRAPVRARADGMAAFGAGFLTALTNPLTAAFFASQFVGALRDDEATIALAPLAAMSISLSFSLGVAALLTRPAFCNAARAWHRPIRLSAAAVLVLMAGSAMRTVFFCSGPHCLEGGAVTVVQEARRQSYPASLRLQPHPVANHH